MRAARIPIGDPQWAEFVSAHPGAGPFHLPTWTTVVADAYRFESFVLVIRDDGGIVAGTPVVVVRNPLAATRWVSLSFSDSCGLLVRPGADAGEAVAAITEFVLANRVSELELRSTLPAAAGCHPVDVGYHQYIALPADPSELHLRKNHRNARNRALRRGIRVVRGASRSDLAMFYRLHTLTRHRLGVPVQPRRFFDLVGDRMLAAGHGFIATALLDGEAVAAGLYLAHNGMLVAKFGASRPDFSDTGAGHLVDWEVMAAACGEGFHTLDFGRTDLGAEGLRLYKAGWGAIEEPLVYTHISRQAPAIAPPQVGNMSRRIISASPTWVARALGEVLYRWTA